MMKWRGPKLDRETEWRALAARRRGEIATDRRGRVKQIRFDPAEWSMVLDTYTQSSGESSQSFTRVRAIYHGRDDFRLRAGRRRRLFSALADRFGRRRVQVGHPYIETNWVVRSNSEGRAQSLLLLPAVVGALNAMRSASVRIERCRGRRALPGTCAITITMSGIVKEPPRLEAALDLCAVTLDHLVRMGCATRAPVAAQRP